jgi:hypothetical protein
VWIHNPAVVAVAVQVPPEVAPQHLSEALAALVPNGPLEAEPTTRRVVKQVTAMAARPLCPALQIPETAEVAA